MTLISKIISEAYRESNLLPLGRAPTDPQVTEALTLYNGLISSLYGGEVGESIADWALGNFDHDPLWTYSCPPDRLARPELNTRLLVLNENAIHVYFSHRPQDGSRMAIADPFGRLSTVPVTLDGNGRTIDGAPLQVFATDGLFAEWFYRADLGGWKKLSDLLATDENPWPKQFDTMFSILLAMRLNPRYRRTLDGQSALMLKTTQRDFTARYLQSAPLHALTDISWPFMSRQGYDTQRAFSSTGAFNRGDYANAKD